MVKIDADSIVVVLGVLLSLAGAAWAMICLVRRTPPYRPLVTLILGGLAIMWGNLSNSSGDPLGTLETVAAVAIAFGVAASVYSLLRGKKPDDP